MRYDGGPEKNSHYALDYRIVTHRAGGIGNESWSGPKLEERAAEFIGDLLTIANNLGFVAASGARSCLAYHQLDLWHSGITFEFWTGGENPQLIMDVKAFKNGNLHLRLNQAFILALNVEHGRLRGWLKSPQEAAEELNDPNAAKYFNGNIRIGLENPTLMLGHKN